MGEEWLGNGWRVVGEGSGERKGKVGKVGMGGEVMGRIIIWDVGLCHCKLCLDGINHTCMWL